MSLQLWIFTRGSVKTTQTPSAIGSFLKGECGLVLYLLTFMMNGKKIKLDGKEIDEWTAVMIEYTVG